VRDIVRRVIVISALLVLLLVGAFLLLRPLGTDVPPLRPAWTDRTVIAPASPPVLSDRERFLRNNERPGDVSITHVRGRAGTVPEALLGRGEHTLFVRLFDAHSTAPVALKVWLWRLDVPEKAGIASNAPICARAPRTRRTSPSPGRRRSGRSASTCPGRSRSASSCSTKRVAGSIGRSWAAPARVHSRPGRTRPRTGPARAATPECATWSTGIMNLPPTPGIRR